MRSVETQVWSVRLIWRRVLWFLAATSMSLALVSACRAQEGRLVREKVHGISLE